MSIRQYVHALLIAGTACCLAAPAQGAGQAMLAQRVFGQNPDGTDVTLYTLTNRNGLEAEVMEYGAMLVSLQVPDRQGRVGEITLGFDDLSSYLKPGPPFGSTIGRYANRIANGTFTLDGVEYQLPRNNGKNHLHGGKTKRFDKVVWKGQPYQSPGEVGVRFSYLSRDGDEGYPGNLDCEVTYALTDDDALRISYQATTDKPTVLNLTNHAYYNLAGAGEGDVLNHLVTIHADQFTPPGEGLIPTGELRSVTGTPLDFTRPTAIGARIEELTDTGGYDHNYVLNGEHGSVRLAARVYEPGSGRVMEIHTTEPGVQFYTANGMWGIAGRDGKTYGNHNGLCLETQHFPDSPNQPGFPSVVLRPGETFTSTTVHRFSTE